MQDSTVAAHERGPAGLMGTDLTPDPALADALAAIPRERFGPLWTQLDTHTDARLVRTAAATVGALVRHRDRARGLLLSELGAYLTGPERAPAGTKRLSNLLHSDAWTAEEIETWLLEQAARVATAEAAQVPESRALCILDGSVLEKPESRTATGLRPVRSSKGARLRRPRPHQGAGYYQGKPGPPTVVPGWTWLAATVTGWSARRAGRPVALARWYPYVRHAQAATPPADLVAAGVPCQTALAAQQAVVREVVAAVGADRLLHVWDREYGSAPWLGWVLDQGWHFVVRWKKGNKLRPADAPSVGEPAALPAHRLRDGVKAWRLTPAGTWWGTQTLPYPREPHRVVTVRYKAREVRLVDREEPLWLVTVSLHGAGPGREPWRLLTTEPVTSADACARVVEAYAARWQIEEVLRFAKSELGVESVRVRDWEPRCKLWALVSLAHTLLLTLLATLLPAVRARLLRWAHRTGRAAQQAVRPLYRLRAALAALWNRHPPNLQAFT